MKVYIGADHRGYELKGKIKSWLVLWGYKFEDLGAHELDLDDDYTLYAEKVGSVVGRDHGVKGILLCGSGVGVEVVANKFDGVRASIGKSVEQVIAGRRDDNMNVLVLAADYTQEDEAKKMLKVFLKTEFSGKARYKRRLEDIKRIEANN
ncbi:hypothetical protein A3D00_04560 [Candidatus Woesebacteria bacterium RIFCSPHIGHO2_02_FULL_38_9]|uniref:Ribose-5-phosphate isomerase n=1 Tax=Candidatus Woesebacteria bacterium RIFCSPHIGHO2_01_FULL_39_28 TaxID=1802496 RepID=A0A1F7YKW4_9BACT|nr:MAG: hypothetical protein A2627_00380 [Candidatus Woesebacteria bacterium RIFCSPHIGHO2_01_FULL_39_28]OGM31899.1 MAG: hypothetical protein A3D00_04560 [Candidatus Woesebacteria bacterium RIFCSPHIGHO2_02_FULL_38_9]OGM56731.1 MAG: hypothetical protein A3A50_05240 [Candidatus Woesebacteria bacterium RIFCSPLOWO2_01_FULL_38_20]